MIKKSIVFVIVVVMAIIGGIAIEGKAAQKTKTIKAIQKQTPQMGGTLILGLGKEPGSPNPFIATISTNQFVKEAAYESLLSSDDDGRIVPNLAEAFEVSAGGTTFTLHLRKGVKFHNGKEMKADDVIWSANHVKDPKNGAMGQNMMNEVKSIEKLDDYTVRVTLLSPSVTLLSNLSNIRMLPIVPANSLQPGQTKLEANAFVPGTGAFVFEQYQPGFDTVLKKFPEYWDKPAYLDKLVFRPITDLANRFNALRAGDVQLADRLSTLDVARVKKGDVRGIKILEEPLGGYQHLVVNYLNPLLQKREMRQALLYATDKQRLIDEVYFGAATKAEMMMDPKGIWAKAANLPAHKRDLAKAKKMLQAAGYNGQELVLPGRTTAAKFLESYQRILGEAGIKVKVELFEAGVMKERLMAGKYDLYIDGANITDDPVITLLPFYYTNKVEKGRYSNSKADQLFDKLDKEFDEKKRLKLFKDLAWTFYNDVADIPLCFEFRYVGMSERVQGYGPPPGYSYSESGDYFKKVWLK